MNRMYSIFFIILLIIILAIIYHSINYIKNESREGLVLPKLPPFFLVKDDDNDAAIKSKIDYAGNMYSKNGVLMLNNFDSVISSVDNYLATMEARLTNELQLIQNSDNRTGSNNIGTLKNIASQIQPRLLIVQDKTSIAFQKVNSMLSNILNNM